MTRNIRSLLDLTAEQIDHLLNRAIELKARRRQGIVDQPLVGKTLGLLFDKASTRTRVSFETAMAQLGGTPLYIQADTTQMARKEPIADTARVLGRYVDALAIRTYAQDRVDEFAKHAGIPVINALTDLYHPCQVLSDLMTVVEVVGGYAEATVAWVGDGNNVANSWISAASILGFKLNLACPEGFTPREDVLKPAMAARPDTIRLTNDPAEAVANADVIYTDVWASMGQEEELAARLEKFKPFQVNEELLAKAPEKAVVMHCLPAHRGEEISEAVLEGPRSVVWDQAENKMHLHKAVLEWGISG